MAKEKPQNLIFKTTGRPVTRSVRKLNEFFFNFEQSQKAMNAYGSVIEVQEIFGLVGGNRRLFTTTEHFWVH